MVYHRTNQHLKLVLSFPKPERAWCYFLDQRNCFLHRALGVLQTPHCSHGCGAGPAFSDPREVLLQGPGAAPAQEWLAWGWSSLS